MKINPVTNANYQPNYVKKARISQPAFHQNQNVSFKGRHACAKAFGSVAGVLGTIGAIGGILIMTGGIGTAAIPAILGYGAVSAASGAAIGHQIDKDQPDYKKNKKDSKK